MVVMQCRRTNECLQRKRNHGTVNLWHEAATAWCWQQVIIRLSNEQQQTLIEWSGRINRANYDEDCLPPGYDLIISVSFLGTTAEARSELETLDLGEVEVIIE